MFDYNKKVQLVHSHRLSLAPKGWGRGPGWDREQWHRGGELGTPTSLKSSLTA